MQENNLTPGQENTTPEVKPGVYNPVHISLNESTGVLLLGILSILLLIGWVRAENKLKALLSQQQVK
jgi:hypothetical protein